ncbi:membrane protein insertase YidC [Deinococcus sonorensis]|uniref:Membrane protein insertase YidC n=2 Tax=Deinococcus sonorensis TaxID=309891 RepID=A0AAU7UEQ5_9DEIO
MTKLLKSLLALASLAALGTAGANVTPEWIQADFNGDGQKDAIYTSNLADIVFNPQGEVIGWYVKVQPGKAIIKRTTNKQTNAVGYDFSALQKAGNGVASNLVGQDGGKALEVRIPGVTGAKTAEPMQLATDIPHNRLTATFRYSQGAATVTKAVVLHPRQFNVQATFNVTGASGYSVNFAGLSRNADPAVKAAAQGGQLQSGQTQVQNIQYAAMQDAINHGFLGLGSNSYTASALIVRPQSGTTANVSTTTGQKAALSLTGLSGESRFDVYGGKNELIHLYQEGYTKLPGVFEPNLFGQISLLVVKFMEWLYSFLGNWGLVILVLTVVLRLAIWPLMQTQGRTTAKMQMVQPLLKEAQEKYKDNPQQLQAETMRLYRENNVNPAGCLSMFVPFPILIALYSTIRNFEFDQGLGWIPDLSIPDPLYILAALYVLANLLQLYVSTRKTPQMFKQQSFIYLIFAYFAITFPAGVTMYWIISTLIGAGQQFLINKQVEAHMAGGLQRVERVAGPRAAKTVDASASKSTPARTTVVKPLKPSKPATDKK